MENFKQLIRWATYTACFYLMLIPLMGKFELNNLQSVSIAAILGFFGGILNEILGTLKSINNQLRGNRKNTF